MSKPLIGLIGAGRAGGALAAALANAGYSIGPLWSRSLAKAAECAARIPGAHPVSSIQAVVDAGDLIVIATPDRAIQPVAESLRWRPGSFVIHCSGGTPVAALDAARAAGCQTGGWHPLKSFAGDARDQRFAGVTFAVEAAEPLRATLNEMTDALGGRLFNLEPQQRALYHASAALASNGLVALLAEASSLWRGIGFERADGLTALLPLACGTLANLKVRGLPAALTGPVERGDCATVASHLAALDGADAGVADTYRRLSRAALALAAEKGGSRGDEQRALEALLAD